MQQKSVVPFSPSFFDIYKDGSPLRGRERGPKERGFGVCQGDGVWEMDTGQGEGWSRAAGGEPADPSPQLGPGLNLAAAGEAAVVPCQVPSERLRRQV